ncbi:MAG: hypothetical protein HEQ22_10285 [Sphingopyxis sp.]|uniref:hypothetical protein n=1 Tax=Sphingopyxis sp. TaxID=1908224 RepID=UPI003D80F6E1
MSRDSDRAAPPGDVGCLAASALFVAVFAVVWLAAITFYGLILEQWELVRVRREFSYDWVLLYAPLIAIGVNTAIVFVAMRRFSAARVTGLIVATGLVALGFGLLLFGLGGLA